MQLETNVHALTPHMLAHLLLATICKVQYLTISRPWPYLSRGYSVDLVSVNVDEDSD